MSRKRSTRHKTPPIHTASEMAQIFHPAEIRSMMRRVDRRNGCCARCHRRLGSQFALALVAAAQNVTDQSRMTGTWQILTTHRSCHKEAVLQRYLVNPPTTYTTSLMAVPVGDGASGAGLRQLPVLMVNPGVDHYTVQKLPTGQTIDGTVHHLETSAGFTRLAPNETAPDTVPGLTAVVDGTAVEVTHPEAGVSWSHLQQAPSHDPEQRELADSFHELLAEWDNQLLIMVSPGFTTSGPDALSRTLPSLIKSGSVTAAPVQVEFTSDPVAV